jgi:hypothetical protein
VRFWKKRTRATNNIVVSAKSHEDMLVRYYEQAEGTELQRLLSAFLLAALVSDPCDGIVAFYSKGDVRIATAAIACFLLWMIEITLESNIGVESTPDVLDTVKDNISTLEWYDEATFAAIYGHISSRMPEAFQHPRTGPTTIVDVIECANVSGHSLVHNTDLGLMLGFEYHSLAFQKSILDVVMGASQETSPERPFEITEEHPENVDPLMEAHVEGGRTQAEQEMLEILRQLEDEEF